MAQCRYCKAIGINMKRCKVCGSFWCAWCSRQGRGPYPQETAVNRCPYCGKYNCIETMR
jgi:hypothetical protein